MRFSCLFIHFPQILSGLLQKKDAVCIEIYLANSPKDIFFAKQKIDDEIKETETLEIEEQPETEPQPELTDEQRAENVANGLCADGTKPNKFGCCGDEVFKDLGNLEFACCPKSGGDCFPPIK